MILYISSITAPYHLGKIMKKFPIEYQLAFGSILGLQGLVMLLFFTNIVSLTAIIMISGVWMLVMQIVVGWSNILTTRLFARFTKANIVGCLITLALTIMSGILGEMLGKMAAKILWQPPI